MITMNWLILRSISRNWQISVENRFGCVNGKHLHTKQIPTKEIKIPVSWGHIAAKLWGDEHERPILAIHGWQDNAGTWDTLIPMLETTRPVLAIDLPGHGFSTRIPSGIPYDLWQWVQLTAYLKEHFKWNKVSLLGHSIGSLACFRYAAAFPDNVDFFIGIESLDFHDYLGEKIDPIEKYMNKIRKFLKRDATVKPRLYTFEDICNAFDAGYSKTVTSQNMSYLMKRGVIQSESEPGKYYISRDIRLKSYTLIPESKEFVNALASQIMCPMLFIKGRESHDQPSEYIRALHKIIQRNNPRFENYTTPGTHHLHLNTPENIAPLINKFLEKYA